LSEQVKEKKYFITDNFHLKKKFTFQKK